GGDVVRRGGPDLDAAPVARAGGAGRDHARHPYPRRGGNGRAAPSTFEGPALARERDPRVKETNMDTAPTYRLKTGLAEMLKGGVILDVTDATQAEIAEQAGPPAGTGRRPAA